ncbi:MAG: glyoxalase/bleomycin resistance/dioxygenase family protein [Burkholderiaceae bacterium]|jgi:hypothetical protein
MNAPICAVLIHVSDVPVALDWYQSGFRGSKRKRVSEFDFVYLDFHGVNLEIVPCDEKVASGAAGAVPYWAVDDFGETLAHFIDVGRQVVSRTHRYRLRPSDVHGARPLG